MYILHSLNLEYSNLMKEVCQLCNEPADIYEMWFIVNLDFCTNNLHSNNFIDTVEQSMYLEDNNNKTLTLPLDEDNRECCYIVLKTRGNDFIIGRYGRFHNESKRCYYWNNYDNWVTANTVFDEDATLYHILAPLLQ